MKVLLLNGTIIGDKTKTLLNEVEEALNRHSNIIKCNHIYLENFQMEFADGRPANEYNDDTQKLINEMETADGYIIATPVFQGSIPGVLKNLFDLISPKALRYKPVAVVANGGTNQHHLVIENQLKPILDYFRCLVTPNYVYTQPSHFTHENELIDEDIKRRIDELAKVFAHFIEMSEKLQDEYLD
ncbi:NADPH-dependent FMN reductase [Bacillaceae bacterium W0354]